MKKNITNDSRLFEITTRITWFLNLIAQKKMSSTY